MNWSQTIRQLDALHKTVVTILSDPRFLYLRQSTNTTSSRDCPISSGMGHPMKPRWCWPRRSDEIPAAALEREVDRLLADRGRNDLSKNFVADWIGFTTWLIR